MEDLMLYIYNPYYAIPGVAILATMVSKALNLFWENQVPDQVWSGIASIGLSLTVVNWGNPVPFIVLQVVASFSLAALFYKYLGTWFIDRAFQALKARLEKVFKKTESQDDDINLTKKDTYI